MSYKLLIFDWDGTLADSCARITDSVTMAINSVGAEFRTPREIRNIIGLGLSEAIRVLYPGAEESFCTRLAEAYRESFSNSNFAESRLFDGVEKVLIDLRQTGYLLAVATGKSASGLRSDLSETGLSNLFDASRCADQTLSKPHPQMLAELLDELNSRPDEALMIGDTEYDMEMASRAGVDSIAVSYGVHESERLERFSPLTVLDDIALLPAFLAEKQVNSAITNS